MQYSDFISLLKSHAESDFAAFQRKLISTPRQILGVRTPMLRRLAKTYKGTLDKLFSYPNEYYETVFIKLRILSSLPYPQFIDRLTEGVALIDNWALCDSFKCKAIATHKKEFLSVLDKLYLQEKEFFQRYVLVSLLYFYVDLEYIPTIQSYIQQANTKNYYVHMAVAWLIAEVLTKQYEEGLNLLKAIRNDVKTYNKAIQKALESFRLTKEQKDNLRSLKIK